MVPSRGLERFGPYRLERTINVGSIGEVFFAWRDAEPDQPVVVKRLHRELARQPEHVALFREEGATARRFAHPNLVKAFDAGEVARDSGEIDHYIAMDLVRGPNLAQLAERGAVPPRAVRRIALDLCAGLAHLHDAGVVHCDVSPTNILIGPDRTQLTDFGVASPAGAAQPSPRGTVAYMSPEQARGDAIDGRSDVFSVGVVAWELLTRRHLFMRAQPYLTLTAVVEDDVPPLDGAAPPALETAIRRALAKDREERWPTAAALGAELAALARADAQ